MVFVFVIVIPICLLFCGFCGFVAVDVGLCFDWCFFLIVVCGVFFDFGACFVLVIWLFVPVVCAGFPFRCDGW